MKRGVLAGMLAAGGLCALAGGQVRLPEPQKESRLMRYSGLYCAVREPKQLVIRDAKGLDHLMANMAAPPPGVRLAKPDFKKQTVVAVFLGAKSTGGWSVEIGEAKVKKDEATISVLVTKPGPGTIVTQAFTYPFAVRAFPALPAKVRLEFAEQER